MTAALRVLAMSVVVVAFRSGQLVDGLGRVVRAGKDPVQEASVARPSAAIGSAVSWPVSSAAIKSRRRPCAVAMRRAEPGCEPGRPEGSASPRLQIQRPGLIGETTCRR
jgi:hypothetical protein